MTSHGARAPAFAGAPYNYWKAFVINYCSDRIMVAYSLVLEQLLADLSQVLVGEHEPDIPDDVRQQLARSLLLHLLTNGLADHSVLAH